MVSGLRIEQVSTATDGDHDLEPVALGEPLLGEPATRHDFAVALEGDALAGKIEPRQQLGAVERRIELAALAVDRHGYHSGNYRGACQESPFSRVAPSLATRAPSLRIAAARV
jgi:hypothetical protein